MFNRNVFGILFLAFVLAASVGVAFAEDNLTLCDDSDALAADEKSFNEIRVEIENAEENQTVSLEGDYKSDGSSVDVGKSCTIDGNGKTTLDFDKKSGSFEINADNVSIRNMKFINSKDSSINGHGNNLLIENCEFIGNGQLDYGYMGSAIYFSSYNYNLTIRNCNFTDNVNPLGIEGRNVAVEDSVFKNNRANSIRIYGLNETISNCQFISNRDGAICYRGYSIFLHGSQKYEDGRLVITKCTFTNNDGGEEYGGAIDYFDHAFDGDGLKGQKFNINEAFIDGCTFTNNTSENGGAIKFAGKASGEGFAVPYSRITVRNSNFTNNRVSSKVHTSDYSGGGAIFINGDDSAIVNCTFEGNAALSGDVSGGAAHLRGDNFTVDGCRFINSYGYVDKNSYRGIIGGAIYYHDGLSLRVSNSLFENSRACEGGAISAELFKYETGEEGSLVVNNCTFKRNTAFRGGAIYLRTDGDVKVNGCDFIENSADVCSAVYAGYNVVEITNSGFTKNTSPWATIIAEKHTFKNNVFSGNSACVFILGENYKAHAYDVNMKRMELIKITAPAVTKVYGSNNYLKIKLVHKLTGKPIFHACVRIVDAKTGELLYNGIADSNGIFKFKDEFNVGTHKVKIYLESNSFYGDNDFSFAHEYGIDPITSTVKVTKIPTKVKAPKVTANFKKSKKFKVTVKYGKKPVKKVKIKIKVGKKTFNAKTNSKGVASINTKSLKVGKHKVVISSANANYKISAKSKIIIKG